MYIHVSDHDCADSQVAVLQPFGVEARNCQGFRMARRPIPNAHQIWTEISVEKQPNPLSGCGLSKLYYPRAEVRFRENRNSSARTFGSIFPGDEGVSFQVNVLHRFV